MSLRKQAEFSTDLLHEQNLETQTTKELSLTVITWKLRRFLLSSCSLPKREERSH
jgi:hypothetical protein